MKKMTLIVLSLLISSGLFSQKALADGVWFTGSIARLYPLSNGDFVVLFKEDSPSCKNTNVPKYHYVNVNQNGVTAEGAQKMYSALLMAATSDKQVTVNFEASSDACYINRLSVNF